jgi:hypothetical protein
MKFYCLLALFFYLTVCGCKSNKREDIKVGMTYDEVEKILGKPMNIDRGANILENSYEYSNELEIKTGINDSNYWGSPMKVNTIGQLLYVSWIYNELQIDTMYIYLKNYQTIEKEKSIVRQKEYYVNDKKVKPQEYSWVDKYIYRDAEGRIIDKQMYDAYKSSKLYKMPEPEKAIKKIFYISDKIPIKENVPITPIKKNYWLEKKYCVLFDASSGRVTQSGYYPFEILKLN